MNSVTQDPINEAKTSTVAINILSEVKPHGEEVTIPAYGRIPCDKQIKFCDYCKEMVTEINVVKSELSSCKEIIRILHEEIREINSLYQLYGNEVNEGMSNKESNNPLASENWTYRSSHRSKYPRLARENFRQLPLETSNQFAPLTNLNEDNECHSATTINKTTTPVITQEEARESKCNSARRLKSKTPHRNVRKVLVMGDSHTRLCATKIKSEIECNFCVQGFVKPGAGAGVLVNSSTRDIEYLTKNDVIILMGGANDDAKNDSKTAVRHIRNFINSNNHTNIVIVNVPHRYDLMQSSCVNREIK